MNNSVFPLRLLPNNVRLQVIKNFDYLQLISFSLISRKSRALVRSFNVKIENLTVWVPGSLCICIEPAVGGLEIEFSIYQDNTREPVREQKSLDDVPSYVSVNTAINERPVTFEWQNPQLSFSQWFQHLQSLFKCEINQIDFNDEHDIYDTVALRNLLPKWRSLEIRQGSHDYTLRILDVFYPCVEHIKIASMINLGEFPHKISIQNLDTITIMDPVTLDDALAYNAVNIKLVHITVTDVNRFLRSWVRGANPRMKSSYIWVVGPPNRLLNGIIHQAEPVDLDQERDEHGPMRERITMRSKKGIQATLISDRNIFWTIEMSVGN